MTRTFGVRRPHVDGGNYGLRAFGCSRSLQLSHRDPAVEQEPESDGVSTWPQLSDTAKRARPSRARSVRQC
jgi:hypothetical protein